VDATVHAIEARRRPFLNAPANPRDFETRRTGTIPAQRILDDPTLSLYAADTEKRELLLVRTPPEVDLLRTPFVYVTQYEEATEVVSIPYETALALAETVELDASRLVIVYSIGRCGSTLVSAALGAVEGSASFSEPDVYFALHALLDRGDPEAAALVRAATLLLCAPRPASAWAIKLRSHHIELAPVFRAAFPEAKTVFLYREAAPWARSCARVMAVFEPSTLVSWKKSSAIFPRVRSLVDRNAPGDGFAGPVDFIAWCWAAPMLRGRELAQAGAFSFTARYEELRLDPVRVLEGLIDACDLAAPSSALAAVAGRDSQEGTRWSRAAATTPRGEMTPEREATFLSRLAEIAPDLAPDELLPGTFALA
jgi:hypothetical protein